MGVDLAACEGSIDGIGGSFVGKVGNPTTVRQCFSQHTLSGSLRVPIKFQVHLPSVRCPVQRIPTASNRADFLHKQPIADHCDFAKINRPILDVEGSSCEPIYDGMS
jgi:hypothetical protein